MATVLMIIIYIAFIGLGIPDSLFGTAWPAIYSEFELPISFGSFVTMIISCDTVISSIVSAKVIARLGTNKTSAYSTLLTAAALLGFSATNDIFAENAWYFRNALVRANYTNLQKDIHETTEYLEAVSQ